METLEIVNYGLLFLSIVWTLFILFNIQANCKKNCSITTIKQCISTYFFGLMLIFALYFAHRWVMLG